MIADLGAWLLADDGPIATDERHAEKDLVIARAAGDWVVHFGHNMPGEVLRTDGMVLLPEVDEPTAWHLGRFKPQQMILRAERTLADCAAKRQVVAALVWYGTAPDAEPARRDRSRSTRLLLALAQPYAGRPGWRDEWLLDDSGLRRVHALQLLDVEDEPGADGPRVPLEGR